MTLRNSWPVMPLAEASAAASHATAADRNAGAPAVVDEERAAIDENLDPRRFMMDA
jgi:hypothetical protein